MGSSLEVRVLWGTRWYEPLAGGNGVIARWGRKEARGKVPTRGTRTAYEAGQPG
jgi:hypothetical protein